MAPKLQIIDTGFGRTGTDSMREALNMLGVGPCHHMRELLADPDHRAAWRRIACGQETDFEAVLGGYGACVDWPSAYYWPHLIRAYPQAKVLLTWRTPESWWASFEKTILKVLEGDTETEADAPGSQLLSLRVFGGHPITRETAIAVYETNVTRVKAEVPPERLLIHSLGDGWDPPCAFLGLPVPEVPYPRTNSMDDFLSTVEEARASGK